MTKTQAQRNGAMGGKAKQFIDKKTWFFYRLWIAPECKDALLTISKRSGDSLTTHIRKALWQYIERELPYSGS